MSLPRLLGAVADSWAERHRPRRLSEVLGNPQALQAIGAWADAWAKGTPKQRALMLVGPPGVGKTTTALALAEERGWGLIELNASDARSAHAIRRVAGHGALNETFSADGEYFRSRDGKRKLIVLDEADNLYERPGGAEEGGIDFSDRGGKRAIVETVAQSQQPIVLIVNDAYALTRGAGGRLGRLALKVAFHHPTAGTVAKALGRVAAAEGVRVAPEVLLTIAQRAAGDVRSAVNDLQALAEGRPEVRREDVAALGYRNRAETVFDALRAIFHAPTAHDAVRAAQDLDEPPDFLLTWIDENLPKELGPDLAAGFDALSRADVHLGRVYRRQAFRLWSYARQGMSGGVQAARSQRPRYAVRYAFPTWLRQMSSSKSSRSLRDAAATKVAAHLHASRRIVLRDMLPWLRALTLADRGVAEDLSLAFGLEGDEIAFLMGPEADADLVRDVVAHVEARRDRAGQPEGPLEEAAQEPAEPPSAEPDVAAAPDRPGRTLFDY